MATKVAVPLDEYVKVQQTEVESSLNRQGAGEQFGHTPTRNELWLHYIACGRAAEMQSIHSPLNVWATGQRLGRDPMALPLEEREKALQETFRLWKEHEASLTSAAL